MSRVFQAVVYKLLLSVILTSVLGIIVRLSGGDIDFLAWLVIITLIVGLQGDSVLRIKGVNEIRPGEGKDKRSWL